MARSLNRVQLIGNLTRDPELRYTPNGTAVCSFGLATNRSWTTETGEKHEESEFHNVVSWNKLAELCSQFLVKGRKVYVEGRLSTRSWQTPEGQQRSKTEVVIDDMILLDSRKNQEEGGSQGHYEAPQKSTAPVRSKKVSEKTEKPAEEKEEKQEVEEQISPDDIPF